MKRNSHQQVKTESGWAWCEKKGGKSGWLPLENIVPIDESIL